MHFKPLITLLSLGLLWLSACSSVPKRGHSAPLLPGMSADTSKNTVSEKSSKEVAEDSVKESVFPEKLNKDPDEPAAAVPGDLPSEILTLDKDDPATAESEETLDDAEGGMKSADKPKSKRVPFEFNQKVADWIQYFSQKDRERFQRFLDRGEPYREVIENIL